MKRAGPALTRRHRSSPTTPELCSTGPALTSYGCQSQAQSGRPRCLESFQSVWSLHLLSLTMGLRRQAPCQPPPACLPSGDPSALPAVYIYMYI